MLRIGANISALNAQGNLQRSNQLLNRTLNRLGTGLRINSGADDAAGLAISSKFAGQIRGFGKALGNIQDGLSLLNTAEGGLSSVSDDLLRIRELTIQAGNGAYTDEDRAALENEARQLLEGIDDTSSRTEFNTKSLLDGSTSGTVTSSDSGVDTYVTGELSQPGTYSGTVQGSVDSEGNQVLELTLTGNGQSRTVSLDEGGRATGALAGLDVQIDNLEQAEVSGDALNFEDTVTLGNAAQATFTDADGDAVAVNIAAGSSTLDDVVSQLNSDFGANNVDLTASLDDGNIVINGNNVDEDFTVSGTNSDFNESFGISDGVVVADSGDVAQFNGQTNANQVSDGVSFNSQVSFTVSDGSGAATQVDLGGAGQTLTQDEIVDTINSQLAAGGQEVTAAFSDAGELQFTSDDVGSDAQVIVEDVSGGADSLSSTLGVEDSSASGSGTTSFSLSVSSSSLNFQTGANQNQSSQFAFGNFSSGGLNLSKIDLQSEEGRNSLLGRLDSAINRVSSARSSIGAQSNRFESQFNNAFSSRVNQTSANSRIADADIAKESVNLAKGLLLEQSGTAILAQANLKNQNLLSLLG